ncbi:MAG: biotin-dependent carboxyltransferase family protein [Pseudomonadota bacterium]
MTLRVINGGVLSLLQDAGRVGHHRLGLANGGPLDAEAFHYCQRLLGNTPFSTLIEISVGGLELEIHTATTLCMTGAPMPLCINGEERDGWTTHRVAPGDSVSVGFAPRGCRAYLGVRRGFQVKPQFSSTATVVREGIGGLTGDRLHKGDALPYAEETHCPSLTLPPSDRPSYQNQVTVRVIPGYQHREFTRAAKRLFFSAPYTVTESSDRMGYRLRGPDVASTRDGILSEGICPGAIQVPPDGQPIVLLNDRQTIGGYPKLGAALSLDTARLAQLTPGGIVHFTPISLHTARRALDLARRFSLQRSLRAPS